MNLSSGKIYNVGRKIERSIRNTEMNGTPVTTDTWGVKWDGDVGRWVLDDNEGLVCCPMGAVLLDRQPGRGTHSRAAARALGIDVKSVDRFVGGFDDPAVHKKDRSAYIRLGVALNTKHIL